MLKMTDETRVFLQSNCPNIPDDREHLNDLLDYLDDLMLDSLDKDYNPTEATKPVVSAYDDLYTNNE